MSKESVWTQSVQLDEFAVRDMEYLESVKGSVKLAALKQILTLLEEGDWIKIQMRIEEPHEDWKEMVEGKYSSAYMPACVWRCSIHVLVDD